VCGTTVAVVVISFSEQTVQLDSDEHIVSVFGSSGVWLSAQERVLFAFQQQTTRSDTLAFNFSTLRLDP